MEKGNQEQKENNTTISKLAESSTATEPSQTSVITEPEQQAQVKAQPSEQQEQEVDSTDSSLAGSDEEEAWTLTSLHPLWIQPGQSCFKLESGEVPYSEGGEEDFGQFELFYNVEQ